MNKKIVMNYFEYERKTVFKKNLEQKLCMNDFKKEGANGNLV